MSRHPTGVSDIKTIFILRQVVFLWLVVVWLTGCDFYQDEYGNRKLLPAPPPTIVPYKLSGFPYGIKRGDELQIVAGETSTFCRLMGVRAPNQDDACFDESTQFLNSLVAGQVVHGTVVGHDAQMRASFRGYVGDLDLNLEMILHGYARYDETEFPGSEAFREAESQARRAGRGMWQSTPGRSSRLNSNDGRPATSQKMEQDQS